MEILETKGRKMNKIKREEREDLHTFSDTTNLHSFLDTTIHYFCIKQKGDMNMIILWSNYQFEF